MFQRTKIYTLLAKWIPLFTIGLIFPYPIYAAHYETDIDPSATTAHIDLIVRVKKEARDNLSLGLIVSHGPIVGSSESISPKDWADGLASALGDVNIDLRTYYLPTSEMGTNGFSVIVTNGHTTTKPMSPQQSEKDMNRIVKEYYRYKRLFEEAE